MNCENIGFISVHFPTAFFVPRLKMTHRNQVSVSSVSLAVVRFRYLIRGSWKNCEILESKVPGV